VGREGGDDRLGRGGVAAEIRVDAERGVAVELQRIEIVGLAGRPNARDPALRPAEGRGETDDPPRPAAEFDERMPEPVVDVVRIGRRQQQARRLIGEVPAHAEEERAAARQFGEVGLDAADPLDGVALARDAGAGVGAAALERDPVRTEIAFLEDVGRDAEPVGDREGRLVVGALVAEADDVGDRLPRHDPGKETQPVGERATIVDAAAAPHQQVAAIQIDAEHLGAACLELFRETPEKRRREGLQEQEGALRRIVEDNRCSILVGFRHDTT